MTLLWIVLFLILIFILFLVIRTMRFKPRKEEAVFDLPVDFDENSAIEHFADMIRIPTISYTDFSLEKDEEFFRFQNYLEKQYPLIHRHGIRRLIGRRGILYHIPGKSSEKPTVLMSHYDVVPVDEAAWSHPPFAGDIEEGMLWGRGTLDTKGTLCAVVESVEHMLKQNFVPKNDLYLSFSGEEETHGDSCPDIVDYFRQNKITPAFVLDEGGAIVEGLFPGISKPFAVIGVGEKGMMDVNFSLKSAGGHASAPPAHSNVGRLAKAICAIEKHPFPLEITSPVAGMFDTLGRHASFAMRLFFANINIFRPLLDRITRKNGGELNAMLRTTTALTKMEGSDAFNVLPPKASFGVNVRYLSTQNQKSILEHYRRIIQDDEIQMKVLFDTGACPDSDFHSDGFEKIKTSIFQTWGDVLVTPYLMMAGSDSRHFSQICPHVYRFSAMMMSAEDRKRIHGNDERISLEEWKRTVAFYIRLVQNC